MLPSGSPPLSACGGRGGEGARAPGGERLSGVVSPWVSLLFAWSGVVLRSAGRKYPGVNSVVYFGSSAGLLLLSCLRLKSRVEVGGWARDDGRSLGVCGAALLCAIAHTLPHCTLFLHALLSLSLCSSGYLYLSAVCCLFLVSLCSLSFAALSSTLCSLLCILAYYVTHLRAARPCGPVCTGQNLGQCIARGAAISLCAQGRHEGPERIPHTGKNNIRVRG